PDRREIMSAAVAEIVLDTLAKTDIPTLDITGGAPEMCPEFRRLVNGARRLGRRVIDRCNLTILLAPGHEDLPEFLAGHEVEIIASLPCYLEENADAQRGRGVFQKSITALRRLNELGYGRAETGLLLNLVYNPIDPSLPPGQMKLEESYRRELRSRYGLEFNQLYTITNMPISRFLDDLLQQGRYAEYMEKLVSAFNPAAAAGVMCRNTLSVDWTGRLYDCDFNQMLGLGLHRAQPQDLRDVDFAVLARRRIVTGQHCYGCTAGRGSSCQGATTSTTP
ncbi:MAG: arsenosugar biosynthesis radical SAM (seleno)protein ArsS, partial [Planctomycetaceae bacterium]